MSRRQENISGLDGLRGIGTLIVLLVHGILFTPGINYLPPAACLAVDFFFLLSGFVVARSYDMKLHNGMSWRQFMIIRTLRLYPMLAIGTAIGVPVFFFAQPQGQSSNNLVMVALSLGSFTLLPVGLLAKTIAYPVNAVVWSLFFEVTTNSLYASRFGGLSTRQLTIFVLLSGIALIPMAFWGGPYIEIGYLYPKVFLLGFVRVTFPFWTGVLLSRVLKARALPRVPITVVGAAFALLLLIPIDSPIYDLVMIIVIFPLILLGGIGAKPTGFVDRACTSLGNLSYPLYLVHVPVFRMVGQIAERTNSHLSPWALITVGATLSILLAHTVEVGLERPVRRWLTLRYNPRGSRPVSQPWQVNDNTQQVRQGLAQPVEILNHDRITGLGKHEGVGQAGNV